jgi:hypothetical protein
VIAAGKPDTKGSLGGSLWIMIKRLTFTFSFCFDPGCVREQFLSLLQTVLCGPPPTDPSHTR